MRWAPARREGLPALRTRLNRLVDEVFGETFEPLSAVEFEPALDIGETADAVVVKAEVPGIEPKDIDISVIDNLLTIRGEKREEKEEKGETTYRMERRYGAFERAVQLPAPVEADAVQAEIKKGLLTITLPKTEKAKPKKISVKGG